METKENAENRIYKGFRHGFHALHLVRVFKYPAAYFQH